MFWQMTVTDWLGKNERSQAWLARKTGLNPSWIYLILADRRQAGPKTLRKLEVAMDMPSGTLAVS